MLLWQPSRRVLWGFDAIYAGDADRIEYGLQMNWRNGAEHPAHVIDLFGERGSWQGRPDAAARTRPKSLIIADGPLAHFRETFYGWFFAQ